MPNSIDIIEVPKDLPSATTFEQLSAFVENVNSIIKNQIPYSFISKQI
jgi:hypothetical protein